MEDPDDKRKTTLKDYLGRTIQVTEHNEQSEYHTYYEYNAAGDLLKVTDPALNITEMVYDTLGRKTSMNDPDMGFWTYTYDANGNLITQTDEKDQTITLTYDELNRKTSKSYSPEEPAVQYYYDNPATGAKGCGRLHYIKKGTPETIELKTTYDGYDAMGRLLSVTRTITENEQPTTYTTLYAYDKSGKRTRMTYPDDYYVDYAYYEGTGLLDTVTGSDSKQFAQCTSYQPTGKMGVMDHENGISTVYGYDPWSTRLAEIETSNGTGDIQKRDYSYSAAGDIIEIADNHNNVTYTYDYDDLHRLVEETSAGAGAYDPINYQYNAIGNITQKTIGASTVLDYSYNDPQPHAVSRVTLNSGPYYDYDYDDNGNMTDGWGLADLGSVVERDITYNADNMPVSIVMSGTTTQFVYDGAGQRAKKVVSGGSTTYYVGAHYEIIDGTATKYVFAGNMRVAKITDGVIHYFHKDHLGSSTVITDATGAEAETSEYMPFGIERDHTGSVTTDYKFTDQELDRSTGLYNYDARLYDPVIGRFISPDTIVPGPTDPQMLNRYSYCRNNPLIYTDPTGHALDFGTLFGDYSPSKINSGRTLNSSAGLAGSTIYGRSVGISGGKSWGSWSRSWASSMLRSYISKWSNWSAPTVPEAACSMDANVYWNLWTLQNPGYDTGLTSADYRYIKESIFYQGCIGVVGINLGLRPDQFSKIDCYQDYIEQEDIHHGVFSIRFYSSTGKYQADENGKVDLSDWIPSETELSPIRGVNFDFTYYDGELALWVGANHGNDTIYWGDDDIPRSRLRPLIYPYAWPMLVGFHQNLDAFLGTEGYNRTVYCVR